MRTPSLCIHCGQNGTVTREATIKGSRILVNSHCSHCGRRWQNSDQRKTPFPLHADEPRERRAQPRQ